MEGPTRARSRLDTHARLDTRANGKNCAAPFRRAAPRCARRAPAVPAVRGCGSGQMRSVRAGAPARDRCRRRWRPHNAYWAPGTVPGRRGPVVPPPPHPRGWRKVSRACPLRLARRRSMPRTGVVRGVSREAAVVARREGKMQTRTAAHGVAMRTILCGLVFGALSALVGSAQAQLVGPSGTPSVGYTFKLPPGHRQDGAKPRRCLHGWSLRYWCGLRMGFNRLFHHHAMSAHTANRWQRWAGPF